MVLLMALLPVLAWGQTDMGGYGGGYGGHGGMGGGGWHGGHRMGGAQQGQDATPLWESIGLDKDQLKQVHQIFDDQQKASGKDRADLQEARTDLDKMMQADQPDRAAIESQIDKMEQLQAELQKSSTWAMLDARALLTPQQRKKLDQALADRRNGGGREMGAAEHGYGGGEPDLPRAH
jgi:Spy/CpxP family protein refolding chaperone